MIEMGPLQNLGVIMFPDGGQVRAQTDAIITLVRARYEWIGRVGEHMA